MVGYGEQALQTARPWDQDAIRDPEYLHPDPHIKKRINEQGQKGHIFRRSKTGCSACKDRRKKCDETRPKCKDCNRLKITCEYPQRHNPMPHARPIRGDNNQSGTFNSGHPDNKLSAIPQPQALTLPTSVKCNCQCNYCSSSRVQAAMRVERTLNSTFMLNTNGSDLCTPSALVQFTAQHAGLLHPAFKSSQRTEKEEMLAGNIFFPSEPKLLLERERCNTALWHLNHNEPNKDGLSKDSLRLLRVEAGEYSVVALPFTCDYGYNITIGKDVSIGRNCRILDCALVRIGDRCVIGPNVSIITMSAPIDPNKRNGSSGPRYRNPIVIEDDCIIGANVTILPGCTVHMGSTVAEGSVVTKVVHRHTTVSGNPARPDPGVAAVSSV